MYDPYLKHFAQNCGLPPADQEDCCQEAWKQIVMSLPGFDSDGARGRLLCWLHTILHNKVTDLLRYRLRHPAVRLRREAEAALRAGDAGLGAGNEQYRQQEAFQSLLARLRARERAEAYRIFQMRFLEERSTSEIAKELNLTTRQVVCRLYHTKARFRLLLESVIREHSSGEP